MCVNLKFQRTPRHNGRVLNVEGWGVGSAGESNGGKMGTTAIEQQ